jgi:hypothetical protein
MISSDGNTCGTAVLSDDGGLLGGYPADGPGSQAQKAAAICGEIRFS